MVPLKVHTFVWDVDDLPLEIGNVTRQAGQLNEVCMPGVVTEPDLFW